LAFIAASSSVILFSSSASSAAMAALDKLGVESVDSAFVVAGALEGAAGEDVAPGIALVAVDAGSFSAYFCGDAFGDADCAAPASGAASTMPNTDKMTTARRHNQLLGLPSLALT
jgi:hypothetical protein